MRDSSQLEEISGAVGLGLLAADVVRAIGRLSRAADISERDRTSLTAAQDLLDALIAPSSGAALPPGLRLLSSSGSAMDALSAVESKAADQDVTEFLRPLAAALAAAIAKPANADRDALLVLRELFSAIGDAEVSHVSRLSRPSAPSTPLWSPAILSSGF